ncbi:protein phosphatase regulator [Rhodotorula kratochvilovae]
MAAVLSSPTPSYPTSSAPLVTPPLLGSPELPSYLDAHRSAPSPVPVPASPRRDAQPLDMPPSPASSAGIASEPSTPTGVHSSLVPAYPYNVAMAPAVFTGGPLPDDSELTTRLPSICVDYLSHDWAEDDVWTSWKAMTRHKSEIANGVRLENASWRTWAKQRGNLKTVSPETLNWLKDSDVTWLYGPLHTAVDAVPPPKVATANERLGLEAFRPLDASKAAAAKEERKKAQKENNAKAAAASPSPAKGASGAQSSGRSGGRGLLSARGLGGRAKKPEFKTKPILKYRSLSDILMPQGQPTSPVVEQLGVDFEDQATISVHHARSDSHLVRLNSLNRKTKRSSPIHSPGSSSPERTASDSSSASTFLRGAAARRNRRHISFNHRVEQCIAIDSSDDVRSYSTASSSDDDDDDVLTFGARSPRHSSFMRPAEPKEPHTIARLGPTTLKSVELYPAPSPAVVFSSDPTEDDDDAAAMAGAGAGSSPPGGANEHVETSPYQHPVQQAQQHAVGQRVMYDYSSPGSAIRSQWDPEDDDDYAMGFDYFTGASGPDLQIGDEYDTAQYGSTHLIGGSHNNYRGGSVTNSGGAGASASYLGGGPYAATSPYHPGTDALDPTSHATQQAASQIPHYRDSLPSSSASSPAASSPSPAASSTSSSPGAHVVPSPSAPIVVSAAQRGPHAPPPTSSAPKRSALKGGRSREASSESAASSASTSPAGAASPALSAASSGTSPSAPTPVGIQAVATAIPAHVMRPGVRRGASSDESERGRSASRGSSSSLEREASARRTSSSISPTSYSPPSAAPIAIGGGAWRGSASYDSLSSVMSGGAAAGSAPRTGVSGGSYSNLANVPEGSGEAGPSQALRIGVGSGAGAAGQSALGRLVTSSSVDSMGSLGSFGAGPNTPTSPTMPSPARRYQPLVPEEDDDARVEDVAAKVIIPATVDDTEEVEREQREREASASSQEGDAPFAPRTDAPHAPVAAPAIGLGHARTSSGPVLRNPSPSAATTETSTNAARPTSSGEGEAPSAAAPSLAASLPADSGSGPGLLKRSPSSNSLSYARQSLLRATQRDESASRSSLDGSSPSLSSTGRASIDSMSAPAQRDEHRTSYDAAADDELGAAAVGGGINVAGTARDLLGAISKGIWGSLGRSSR